MALLIYYHYLAPKGWYQYDNVKMSAHKIRILPPPIPEEDMRRYYEKTLAKAPDVWDVSRVCAYTGYNHRAVGNWIRKGRPHTVMRTHKYFIPKCFLIDYFCSAEYWNIIRKSREHIDMGNTVPDAKTIWLFRETLKEAGVIDELFDQFGDLLKERGLITREGSRLNRGDSF